VQVEGCDDLWVPETCAQALSWGFADPAGLA